ncbi:MAG: helix-turn-helix transcriptional regulator [Rhodospirillales bacterium]|nr:helix-turn-helix transcriptional regulator [Rhodospirillales bacterium]
MAKNKTAMTDGNSIERHIGRRLRQRRLECDLSLEAMDKLIDGRKGKTKAFEEGKRFVGPSDLFAFSAVLEVDVAFFFLDAGKRFRKAKSLPHTPEVVKGAQRLIQAYYNIQNRTLRRKVVDLLKDLADDETLGDS